MTVFTILIDTVCLMLPDTGPVEESSAALHSKGRMHTHTVTKPMRVLRENTGSSI